MNENLNLVEILKDCPQGTKLYSTIHGEVELYRIIINEDYPIEYKYKNIYNDDIFDSAVMIDGRYSIFGKGECTLFPSKDQRDWSKFNIEPKFDITTLKPFDKVLTRDTNTQKWRCDLFESYIKGTDLPFNCIFSWYEQCIPYNEDTKHLVGTTKMPLEKYINWEE